MKSAYTGIFYPLKVSGDYIAKGMKIGYTTDFFGNVKEEVFAEANGIILYIIGTPPVKKGETIASIGHKQLKIKIIYVETPSFV